MHLGNGAITAECAVLTLGAAGAGLAAAGVAVRRQAPSRDRLLLAAGLSALVFAAQAINVPVWPGVSAHLVGGVLLAWAVGPAVGALAMAGSLVLQSLALGDGGLAALGANLLNMALLPAALVAVCQRVSSSTASAGMAALLSVPLAAGLIVVQTSLFRPAGDLAAWSSFAGLMLGTHLWMGVLEAALTIAGIATIGWLARRETLRADIRPALASLGTGLLLAAVVFPLASTLPDGYEAAAELAGREGLLTEEHAELAQVGPLNAAAANVQQHLVGGVQTTLGSERWSLVAATLLVACTLAACGALAARREELCRTDQ